MGTKTDFEKKIYTLYPSLCKKAHKYIINEEVCKDIVQECLINYWEHYEKRIIIKNMNSYLSTAVKNNCINYLRKEKNKEDIELDRLQNLFYFEEIEDKNNKTQQSTEEIISQALSLLPNKCRQIFELSKIHHKSYKEIAEKLNISTKTVENQMGKSLKIMKQFVKDNPQFFQC